MTQQTIPADTPLTVTMPAGVLSFASTVLHSVPVPGVPHDQMAALVSAFDAGVESGLAAWRAAQVPPETPADPGPA